MMKTLLATFLLASSLSASAAPIFIFPTCNNSPSVGECTLVNSSTENVNCTIQVSGQTKNGGYVSATDYRYLYPGMFAWVRVYAPNPQTDPLVYVRATAFCNTL